MTKPTALLAHAGVAARMTKPTAALAGISSWGREMPIMKVGMLGFSVQAGEQDCQRRVMEAAAKM